MNRDGSLPVPTRHRDATGRPAGPWTEPFGTEAVTPVTSGCAA